MGLEPGGAWILREYQKTEPYPGSCEGFLLRLEVQNTFPAGLWMSRVTEKKSGWLVGWLVGGKKHISPNLVVFHGDLPWVVEEPMHP